LVSLHNHKLDEADLTRVRRLLGLIARSHERAQAAIPPPQKSARTLAAAAAE